MNARSVAIAAPSPARVWTTFTLAFLLMVSLLSSVMSVRGVSAQAADSIASVVPVDTVMYMSLDLDQESEQWVQTQALLQRAGLSDLAEDELGASTEDLGDAAESTGITGDAAIVFTDADSLVTYSSGDFANVADPMNSMDTAMSDTPEVPEGFALVMQPVDPAAMSAQFIDMATDEAAANDAELMTADYNGVTITYWESNISTVTATATAEVDGTVVMATRPSDIEPIIDTVQGTTENLASHDGFNSVYDKLETNSLVFGYMNLEVLMTAVLNDPVMAETLGGDEAIAKLEAAKGYAGWTIYATDAGFHMDSVYMRNDESAQPDAESFTPAMASKIPADVMLFANGNNLYSTGISESVGTLMQVGLAESESDGMTTPVSTPTLDETWATFEQMLGFNPDTDLLAKLDGEYAVYAGVYDLESDMPNPEFLMISGTSDAATLTDTTAKITQLMEQMNEGEYEVSSRSVEGGELTVITISADSTGGLPVVIEFGVVNDEMLIGMNGAIDKYLAGDQPMLADEANFQETFAQLPSENLVSVSYLNIEGQVMPLLDMLVATMESSSSTLDNHEDCGTYATQPEAQDAYDADPSNLWLLDMDYDGEACEDFFGQATAVASPVVISDQVNVPSAGTVTYIEDGAYHVSSIILIGD